MKRPIVIVASALLLASCASASHTYAPDGRRAYSLNCSGWARTWGACYEKAGRLCGASGYDVLSGGSEGGAAIGGGPNAFFGSTLISRSMLIACKKPS